MILKVSLMLKMSNVRKAREGGKQSGSAGKMSGRSISGWTQFASSQRGIDMLLADRRAQILIDPLDERIGKL